MINGKESLTNLVVTLLTLLVVMFVSIGLSWKQFRSSITFQRVSCPLCSFRPLYAPTSSKRDVVLAAALTKLKNVEYFLRTLRTTGTNARIVLFLDRHSTVSYKWLRLFSACDIEPVFIKHTNPVIESAPKLSRYYFEQQWLSQHIDEVDRVLHTDSFDVIFQSDPFLSEFNSSKLYFTLEPVTLGHSIWTEHWIQQCYDDEISIHHSNEKVSCSGVTIGGARQFLTYLNILLATPKWTTCFGHSLDQAHHNFLLFTGEFARNGLEIDFLDCSSQFLTMHFCCKREHCELKGDIFYGPKIAPVLIHQYNRWKNLTKRNSQLCQSPKTGLLGLTKHAPVANLGKLPPLRTSFPSKTLWPPGIH